ncbi:uncharacterized protein I206_103809 [Kwoniella pini CBS 10737]|uniref:C3HC-type domain-containing protein n=1 Tax=Kwoniella pini CBS 10737 TaxID=1296096 RepID=A0A1B9HSQ2_9TREE|nr:uncharacterized protein I206_07761 [Kwoniella pini CBS 10737]OCF46281.1 hypothetical protein I206_07761 [Kwoniella pini CBS 10737]
MSSPSSTDDDLRDVFKLLYADDDWSFDKDEEDEQEFHPPLNSIIPDIELDVEDNSIQSDDLSSSYRNKYSKKRFIEALDSLLPITSLHPNKSRRIYLKQKSISSSSSFTLSYQPLPSLPSSSDYLPYSPLALLSRLKTYQTYSYTSDSEYLTPIKASLAGWINSSRNTLKCGSCGSNINLNDIDNIKDDRVKKEVCKRLSKSFELGHKAHCAWKIKKSPDELYNNLRKSLHPLISSSIGPLAVDLHKALITSSISFISPLTHEQETTLLKKLQQHSSLDLSKESVLLAFFGWYPYYPNKLSDHIQIQDSSENTNNKQNKQTDIIHCRICSRRIGVWTFIEKKPQKMNLLKEHLNWCPLNQTSENQKWWINSNLINEYSPIDFTKSINWIKISDHLEKKPWRR